MNDDDCRPITPSLRAQTQRIKKEEEEARARKEAEAEAGEGVKEQAGLAGVRIQQRPPLLLFCRPLPIPCLLLTQFGAESTRGALLLPAPAP